ncbi:SCO2522 family protein [Streptomyces sp. INA 01156]
MTDEVFHETRAEPRTQAVPLSRLYMEDFEAGPEHLRKHFGRVRPWAEATRAVAVAATGGERPRISTCFLIDDYFTRFSSPAEVVPLLLAEADRAGLAVDYLARESGCAVAGKVPVAEAVARLVEEPPPESYGLRQPVAQTGWLANGERSPVARPAGDERAAAWQPPRETVARRHSVFLDVELWSDAPDGQRTWSCPFLTAMWQLARLACCVPRGRPSSNPSRTPPPASPKTGTNCPR